MASRRARRCPTPRAAGGARRDPPAGERHRSAAPVLRRREARGERRSSRGCASAAWRRTPRSSAATRPSPSPTALLFGATLAGGLLQRSGNARRAPRAPPSPSAARSPARSRATCASRRVSDALATEPSVNVVARVPAGGAARRRVCLVGHLDTSRSGADLPSRDRAAPRETCCRSRRFRRPLLAAGPLLRRLPGGRALHAAALGGMVFSLAMLAERELRGEDVPGASDNASGAAVAMQLAAECAAATARAHPGRPARSRAARSPGCWARRPTRAGTSCARPRPRSSTSTPSAGTRPLTYILREGSATVSRPALRAPGRACSRRSRSAGPSSGLVPGAHARPACRPTRRRCSRAAGRRSRCSRRATRSRTTTGRPTRTRTSIRRRSAARSRPGASCCARSTPQRPAYCRSAGRARRGGPSRRRRHGARLLRAPRHRHAAARPAGALPAGRDARCAARRGRARRRASRPTPAVRLRDPR